MNIYRERMLNVVRAVEEGREENFDMNSWGSYCGTPACALGHYAARTDLQNVIKLGGGLLRTACGAFSPDIGDTIREHFGITDSEFGALFGTFGCGEAHRDRAKAIAWLKDFIDCARKSAAGPAPFGLFGTAIAATWLWPAVSERVQFFVEEDPNRIGRTHMGRPILSPAQAPSGAVVFLALVPSIASSIRERLKYLPIDFRTPPRMP